MSNQLKSSLILDMNRGLMYARVGRINPNHVTFKEKSRGQHTVLYIRG